MADLSTLFQSDPAAQALGIQQMAQERAYQQAQTAGVLQRTQEAQEQQPAKLAALNLANQTTEYQLPGVQATASLEQDRAKLSRDTLGKQFEAAIAKHGANISEDQAKELASAGQQYAQAGPMIDSAPPAARHALARQVLGSNYHDNFDNIPPEQLGSTISQLGDHMNQAASKYQLQLATVQAKAASAQAVAQTNAEARVQAAAIGAQARAKQYTEEYLAAKAKYGNDPQAGNFYHDQHIKFATLAASTEDPQLQQHYLSLANNAAESERQIQAKSEARAAAAAVELGKGKIAPQGFGMPSVTPPTNSPGVPVTPTKQTPPPGMTLEKLKQMYPGKDEATLKQSYKDKFGVDIK